MGGRLLAWGGDLSALDSPRPDGGRWGARLALQRPAIELGSSTQPPITRKRQFLKLRSIQRVRHQREDKNPAQEHPDRVPRTRLPHARI